MFPPPTEELNASHFNRDVLTFSGISAIIHQRDVFEQGIITFNRNSYSQRSWDAVGIIMIGEDREFRKFKKRFGKV